MYFQEYVETSQRELVEEVLRRLEQALVPFGEALEAFLDQLFSAPLPPDWREHWHTFVSEQLGHGFVVAPQSVTEMEAWIEAWAKHSGLWVEEEVPAPATAIDSASASSEPKRPMKWSLAMKRKMRAVASPHERAFLSRLDRAQTKLDEMQANLAALASKLDATKSNESIEVEDEVDAIEGLIWEYNDELESAQEEWLRADLSSDLLSMMYEMTTPLSFGLPLFADEDQYRRYREVSQRISARLNGRDVVFGRVILAAEMVEWAGNLAGAALTGGVIIQAAKQGGKWGIIKLAAKAAAAKVVGDAINAGLEKVGVDNQALRGLQLATTIVSFVILRRKYGGKKSNAPEGNPRPGATSSPASPAKSEAATAGTGGGVQANKMAGDAARDLIAKREAPTRTEQVFKTVGGARRVDVVKIGNMLVGIESKVGRTSLNARVRKELARDWWLLRQGKVGAIRWEFSRSRTTGGLGPSASLLKKLERLGFEVKINQ